MTKKYLASASNDCKIVEKHISKAEGFGFKNYFKGVFIALHISRNLAGNHASSKLHDHCEAKKLLFLMFGAFESFQTDVAFIIGLCLVASSVFP